MILNPKIDTGEKLYGEENEKSIKDRAQITGEISSDMMTYKLGKRDPEKTQDSRTSIELKARDREYLETVAVILTQPKNNTIVVSNKSNKKQTKQKHTNKNSFH